jgi:hypothetical protein
VRRPLEKGDTMADRLPLSALSDSELEQRLIDLGPRLYPTTPDLATQVRHRLETEPARGTLTPLPARPSGHPVAGTRPVGDRRGGTERLPSPRSEGRRAGDEGRSGAKARGSGARRAHDRLFVASTPVYG